MSEKVINSQITQMFANDVPADQIDALNTRINKLMTDDNGNFDMAAALKLGNLMVSNDRIQEFLNTQSDDDSAGDGNGTTASTQSQFNLFNLALNMISDEDGHLDNDKLANVMKLMPSTQASTTRYTDFSQDTGADASSSFMYTVSLKTGVVDYFGKDDGVGTDFYSTFQDQLIKMFSNDEDLYVINAGTAFVKYTLNTDLKEDQFKNEDGTFSKEKFADFLAAVSDENGRFSGDKYDAYIEAQGGTPTYTVSGHELSDAKINLNKYYEETKQSTDEWVDPDIIHVDPLNLTVVEDLISSKVADEGGYVYSIRGSFSEPDDQFATKAMSTTSSTLGTIDKDGIISVPSLDGKYITTFDPSTTDLTIGLADVNEAANTITQIHSIMGRLRGTSGDPVYNEQTGLIEFSDGTYFIPDTDTYVFSNNAINAEYGSLNKVQSLASGEVLTRAGVYAKKTSEVANLTVASTTDEQDAVRADYLIKGAKDYSDLSSETMTLTDAITTYYTEYLATNGRPSQGSIVDLILGLGHIVAQMGVATDPESSQYWGDSEVPYNLATLANTDVYKAWDEGYDGTGMVVAVIDNGLEVNPDLRLDDDSTAAISEADAQAAIDKLGYGTYLNSKIPFAYSYSDNDSDNTDTYQVDHGEHVSGIIAANGEKPAAGTGLGGLTSGLTEIMSALQSNLDSADTNTATFRIDAATIDDLLAVYRDALGDSEGADAVLLELQQEATRNAEITALKEQSATASETTSTDGDAETSTTDETEALNTSVIREKVVDALNQLATDEPETYTALTNFASALVESYSSGETIPDELADSGYAVGIAPEAQILDMRVISNNGYTEADELSRAIRDAVDLGADVINMSIGGSYMNQEDYNTEEEAIQYAKDHGVIVSVAASNSGTRANVGDGGGDNYTPENYSQLSNPATSPDAISVAAQGDLSTEGMVKAMMGIGDSSQVASFSSWGPNSDFSLKPDVTADGVSVNSLEYEDQNQSMSGTSMATPVISGVSVLIKQHFEELGLTGSELVDAVKDAIMNSANILEDASQLEGDDDESPIYAYSPRQQGAGSVDAGAAAHMTVTAEGDKSGTGSVSLYSVGQSTDFQINFHNYGEEAVTYTFTPDKNTVLTSAFETDADGNTLGTGVSHDSPLTGGQVTTSTMTFTVKPNEELQLTMTLSFDDTVAKDQIVEGFLTFTSDAEDGTNNISVPYLAFYGDLTDENVFDVTGAGYSAYLEDGDSQLPLGLGSSDEALKELVNQANTNFANDGDTNAADDKNKGAAGEAAETGKYAISPNADSDNDSAQPVVYTTQNLKSIKAEILDADGNVVRVVDNETDIDASGLNSMAADNNSFSDLASSYSMLYHSDALKWDGQVYDQKTGKLVAAADGEYTYRITGTLNYEGEHQQQTQDFKITVDTQAPSLTGASYDASTNTVAFNYADDNSAFTVYSQAVLTINGQDTTHSLENDGQALSGNYSYQLTDAELAGLKAGDGQILLTIHDVAGNAATATIATNLGTGAAVQKPSAAENTTAPTFQFYASDDSRDNYSLIAGTPLKEYGFNDLDGYSTLKVTSAADTGTLKAHITGANAESFLRNELTGEIFTPYQTEATDDGGYDAYFHVTGIHASEALMDNLGAAVFAGYAIAPTSDAGTYKESLVDSIYITAGLSGAGEDLDNEFLDSTILSPFTDPQALKDVLDAAEVDSLGNIKYDPAFEVGSLEIGYTDSHTQYNFYKQLEYDLANNWREKGHTLDANHASANTHSNVGSDADYEAYSQDVLTFSNPADGNEVRLNTLTDNPDYDPETGAYTIKGHLETSKSAYDGDITNARLVILGESTYEDDAANQVQLDENGDFTYTVTLEPDSARTVSYVLSYQLINDNGNTGELRVINGAFVFENDAEDPTLTLDAEGLDTGAATEDGTYTYTTNKDTFDLKATINDNDDDYTLTVNGNQVFRQKTGGEPMLMGTSQEFGAYTYSESFALNEGKNYITVEAEDSLGNTVTKVLVVTYDPDAETEVEEETTTPAEPEADAPDDEGDDTDTGDDGDDQTGADTDDDADSAASTDDSDATTSIEPAADAETSPSTKTSAAAYPQTGNETNTSLTLVGAMGLAAASFMAFFGFAKKRHED